MLQSEGIELAAMKHEPHKAGSEVWAGETRYYRYSDRSRILGVFNVDY